MKKITTIIIMAVFSLLLVSCSVGVPESDDKKWLNTEIPQDEIILISRYINYAWGYTDTGTFIDSDGKVYLFDFSNSKNPQNAEETDAQFLEKLNMIRKNEQPCTRFDTESMQKIYYYSSKINKDAEFNGKGEACDMGENQLIICDTDTHELVLCRERGDYTGQLKDSNAKKLISFFDESIKEQLKNLKK